MLGFLAEHRVALVPQVQQLLGCGTRAAQRRLRWLEEARLVRRERVFQGFPTACWITRAGLGAVESRLPAPRIDLKGYRHDVGAAWLWLAARAGAFGALDRAVAERTMRSADRREGAQAGRSYGVGLGGGRLHYPDLLLETKSGHRVAVELELTGKSARRLARIMLGYAGDPRIDSVLYLCPPGQLGRRVQAAARRAGIADLVRVQQLAPGSPSGAPDPGRVARRDRVAGRDRGSERVVLARPARRTRSQGLEL